MGLSGPNLMMRGLKLIVYTPENAFRCFMGTDNERLVASGCIPWNEDRILRCRRLQGHVRTRLK
jgi:hypothetical protein